MNATRLLQRRGLEALSMQAVAEAVGVTAPALYKRFTDRDALVRAVQRRGFAMLARALREQLDEATRAHGPQTPATSVRELARAYRRFAQGHPRLYEAMFATIDRLEAHDVDARRAAAEPLLAILREHAPGLDALRLARTFTAFVHGFNDMERHRAFGLGDGIDEAFDYGIALFARALMPA